MSADRSAFVTTAPRIAIASNAGELSIVVPGRPSWIALFLVPWLCMWTAGGIGALHEVLRPSTHPDGRAFLCFWLMGWAFGECAVAGTLLWMLAGRERLSVTNGVLTQWRGIGPLGRTRRFEIADITHLVLAQRPRRSNRGLRYGISSLNLAFDYGTRTYWIASDGDEAESRAILDALRQVGVDRSR